MKIPFKKTFSQAGSQLMRRCGYAQIHDYRSDQISYVKRLAGGHYPRFHCYINSEDPLVLSLHLDQKKASYEGVTAHSGDYDSNIVRHESLRIYNAILQNDSAAKPSQEEPKKKKGLFGLFGKE